ncbi:MAG: aminotransferase class I/II-fold pyridoxal phosphate-dependent enzyme [Candidatus Levybacteria bacterium]|nr:aminotransferase class I/II-fold pyridoxal phosphate-dependent enzyme [Candidatus Levybacteria bacterium]
MKRPIAISLSPNATNRDVFWALRLLLSPWEYDKKTYVEKLEMWFRSYFQKKYAISFASGRASLLSIFKALHISSGDEILLQAFTCVALPDAIIAFDATPVYCDITDRFCIDPEDVKRKITNKTKAIIVQHTFGIPAQIDEVVKIAKEKGIYVIEDCAHGIGAAYKGKKLGTFGDVSFFSFGRDKAFSSVFGGMAVTDNELVSNEMTSYRDGLPNSSSFWIMQQLFHPVAFAIIMPLYNMGIGKAILVLLQRLHLLSFPVTKKEKSGKIDHQFVRKMPGALAKLALIQLERLEEFNAKRIRATGMYTKGIKNVNITFPSLLRLPLLRFPVLVKKPDRLHALARRSSIYLGTWYSHIIDPNGTEHESIFYKKGMCPNAEKIAGVIVNLPTYPLLSEEQIREVISMVNAYV